MASPKIPKKVLTVKGVENAKPDPDGRRREIPDAGLPGLYLIVQSSGAKSFALRYRIGGRTRKLTIGNTRKVTLAGARLRAQEALGDIARGS